MMMICLSEARAVRAAGPGRTSRDIGGHLTFVDLAGEFAVVVGTPALVAVARPERPAASAGEADGLGMIGGSSTGSW